MSQSRSPTYSSLPHEPHEAEEGGRSRSLTSTSKENTAEVSAHPTREQREAATVGSATKRSCDECSTGALALVEEGMHVLDRKRGETESGAGRDHDLPYAFTLPGSWPQVRAWIRLLARVHRGKLQP